MTKQILTIDELAERWQVSRSNLYPLCRQGKVPRFKVGQQWRFKLSVIEAYERGQAEMPDGFETIEGGDEECQW